MRATFPVAKIWVLSLSSAKQFHKVLLLSALAAAASLSSWAQIAQIVRPIDETKLVRLTGNTHPSARPKFDRGLVDSALPMERMLLVLKRSPQQEASLERFMEEQYDPNSPNFHRWLHAEEFGEKYGPPDSDLVQVTGWLQKWGFRVENVNKGRTLVEFSGTAAQVQQAFHTEIHRYLVKGVEHIANDRDPEIPEALAPVVTGVASLHDFFPKPQSVMGKLVKRDRKTGKITPVEPADSGPHGMAPQFTYTDGSGNIHEDITPFDFATIYNELPLWNSGITGAGVPIAISACSDIDLKDVANFRASFGLPANPPTVIHNGTDPGLNGCQVENTLDVEWSGAAAPGASIVMVVSDSTKTTPGFQLSDKYIVDNAIAPIMSASYGTCELNLGSAGNASYNSIWQQGAAEGISIFESAGDQGSTGCEDSDQAGPNAATTGLQVNGMASSPYVTAVGGTDFAWQYAGPISTYWNSTNNADGATAKGYIPETPWNSTCASDYIATNFFTGGPYTPEELCNDVIPTDFDGLIVITGGSGGKSACTSPSGTTPASCSGGYAKPSWQKGTGVPADGKRDLPDVSLFASAGIPDGLEGSAYLICESANSPTGTCDYSDPDYIVYQEVGGTSVSSPALAGIMALVLQQTGAPQGLANPVFYALAAKETLANCNSSTVANGNSCVFYDTTYGTNAQVCITGSTNCVTKTSGDELGIVSGYTTTKGYDLATGWGSVNAANLVNAWASAIGKVTLTPTSLTFPSTVVGATSAAMTITVKNSGGGVLSIYGIEISGTDYKSFGGTTTCPFAPATLAAAGTCKVSLTFTPAAAGKLTAQLSIFDNAVGTPQIADLSGTGTAPTPVVSLTPKTLTFPSTKVGSTTAAKVVTLKNTGKGVLNIKSGGITITGTDKSSFTKTTTCGATVAAGASCTISVKFKPAATGALKATLDVADNAAGSPQSVSLAGTGASAADGR